MLFIVLVRVSTIGESVNSRKKTSKFAYYEHIYIRKKAQPVTMIANSEINEI